VSERQQPSGADWSAAAQAGSFARREGMAGVAGVTLPATLLQEIIDASRAAVPNEAVGLLVADRYARQGGRPTRYVPMRNAAASPYRYLLDPDEQLRVMLQIDDADEVVWGIVHSHVGSAAVPSATDAGLAFYPDSLYLICSLGGEVPEVRAWTIRDGHVTEVPLGVSQS
jgi:[CysO sulfur-carrier protein]-S-L-cysteine hydrolase